MRRCWPASWRIEAPAGVLALALVLASCQQTGAGGEVIARYRTAELRVSPAMDSLGASQPAAEQWLRTQIMAQAALDSIPAADSAVEPLVQRYRAQLLQQLYRQQVLAQVDTVVTEADVQAYYQAQAATFRADVPYVYYRLVRIPQQRVPPGLVSRLALATADELAEWRLLCVDQPEAHCRITTAWADLPGLGTLNLPDPLLREAIATPAPKPLWAVQRIGSTDFVVAFVLLQRVQPGEQLPLDISLPAVVAAIRAQRTNDYLHAYETRLLQQALQNRDAQILLPAASPR